MRATGPTFRSLTHAECDAVLARNHLGRVAFTLHDRVDIQPIHYAYEAGWLFGRTSEGTKLATLAHNHWLAFEVDEVRGPFDWVSVVVHGTFHLIDAGGSPRDRAAAARAMHLLREVVPETFAADDPAPFRTVLFRVAIGEITGRAAASHATSHASHATSHATDAISDRAAPAGDVVVADRPTPPTAATPRPAPPPEPSGW